MLEDARELTASPSPRTFPPAHTKCADVICPAFRTRDDNLPLADVDYLGAMGRLTQLLPQRHPLEDHGAVRVPRTGARVLRDVVGPQTRSGSFDGRSGAVNAPSRARRRGWWRTFGRCGPTGLWPEAPPASHNLAVSRLTSRRRRGFCQISDNDRKSGAIWGGETALAESGGGRATTRSRARKASLSEI